MTPRGDYLLYDGECPVCAGFVAFGEFRRRHPGIALLDARHEPDLVASLRAKGYDVNDGMVLVIDGRLYFGGDASRKLSSYSVGLPVAKRGAMAVVKATPYPLLRGARNALLRLRGKPPIA